ncbi:MAG: serine protease [Crocinitomix sp.]|nr:serine protease [Crocinitomix sp.]
MKVLLIFSFLFIASPLFAYSPPDEGMWLPMLIKDYNYEEMKRLGCKLTPEQIYSVNETSLKDAIVQLGGFCTAEVISDQGLIITNHHCAFDAIASQSSEAHNYLKDGFWAQNKSEELSIDGLSVTFLVRMEDVSDRIVEVQSANDESTVDMAVMEEIETIETESNAEGRYVTEVKEMFNGNAHYLFVYEVFTDIRLVGAPPSSIGKFGGDTDNWMWPRHTGDFSLLRIYSDENNSPVSFSKSNKPLKPKHFLPISAKGLNEGDFTMVMGYPGSTDRYLTSQELNNLQNVESSLIIDILAKRMNIMNDEMSKSESLSIEYASSRASLSNTLKYYQGQLRGLKKFGLIEKKQLYEKSLTKWIDADVERKEKYGTLFSDFTAHFAKYSSLSKDVMVVNMALFAPDLVNVGISGYRFERALSSDDESRIQASLDILEEEVRAYIAKGAFEMDSRLFMMALEAVENDLSADRQMTDLFDNPLFSKKAKGSKEKFTEMVFKKSFLTNEKALNKFLKKPTQKALDKDPGMLYVNSLIGYYRQKILMDQSLMSLESENLRSLYTQAIHEKEADKTFYPDANFTMRVTYGTIKNYDSWEGKTYETFTYGNEILDKYKAGDKEFDVPEKLRTLLSTKDFGDYATADGKLPVCFLHNTDITGGNSGSPVINGDGHLIGVAFDGNWESMTSDLFWQDDYVRTISVDIRYVLFIIDKFAGATHIIDELEIVR